MGPRPISRIAGVVTGRRIAYPSWVLTGANNNQLAPKGRHETRGRQLGLLRSGRRLTRAPSRRWVEPWDGRRMCPGPHAEAHSSLRRLNIIEFARFGFGPSGCLRDDFSHIGTTRGRSGRREGLKGEEGGRAVVDLAYGTVQ
jgi:hypothetical protein